MESWVMLLGLILSLAAGTFMVGSLLGRNGASSLQFRDAAELEELLAAVVAATRDAIVITDAEGEVVLWSEAASRVLGWKDSEAMGATIQGLLGFPGLFSAWGGNPSCFVEHVASTKEGGQVPLEISLAQVSLRGKNHWVLGMRDVTEERRTREETLKARQEAEAVNRDLEEAIERANIMAMEAELANAAKSVFLANMSHEIRTPMNGIIGMTGLLLETDLSPEQREYAEVIRNCSEALLSLINDILDFSKIEAGKLELEVLDFDLRLALEEAVDVLAVKAAEKGLEFVCVVDPAVPSLLRGDPGRLRQVVLNLTGNAIKFTAEGEVIIRVDLEKEEPGRVTLRFQVSDTGIGIPRSKIPMLFRPFTQLDGSTTRKFGGTGLGLSISKHLVELMGGSIGVDSQPGKGSTFWFTVCMEKQAKREAVEGGQLAELRGKRVLVVDDHATNRLLLRTLLENWGCVCMEAKDGQEALRALKVATERGEPLDLVIIDMLMPRMNGEELGQRIKEDPNLKSLPLIMLTSLGRRGDAKRLQEIGFAGYLTKPVRASQLRRCLEMVLGRAQEGTMGLQGHIVTRHTLSEERKRSLKILLVEDDPTNRRVALGILDKLGYRADVAANGKEAVGALQRVPYDLVLMDCQMPEMDGYQATRLIRDPSTGALNPRVPVIAMTANAMQGDRAKCLEAGMDDYIAKPIRAHELASTIESWGKRLFREEASVACIDEQAGGPYPQQPVPEAPAVLERESLLERVLGDEALAQEILAGFMEELPRQLEALRQALCRGDWESSRRWAHTIKGSAGNVGAMELKEVAFQVEMCSKERDLAKAAQSMEGLEKAFCKLQALLRDRCTMGRLSGDP